MREAAASVDAVGPQGIDDHQEHAGGRGRSAPCHGGRGGRIARFKEDLPAREDQDEKDQRHGIAGGSERAQTASHAAGRAA